MAITAVLDCIGKTEDGKDVAYIKLYKDGVFAQNLSLNYDPINVVAFKEEVGKRILNLEKFTESLKTSATAALTEVVQEKEIEINALKQAELEEM